MAVMLLNWRKFCEDFFADVVWRNHYLLALLSILDEGRVVLLEPHILVELSEGQ